MQIIWLRAFVALAEHMNFSDAANEIFVSQSSLSKYIQMIEKTTEVPLFDRSRRRVELTPAGAQFYRYAVDIISQYDEMMSCMQSFSSRKNQRVQIATVSATHVYGYTALFFEYFRDNPEEEFSMQEMEMNDAMASLKNGESDFAVVRTNLVPDLEQYNEIRFNTEKMYVLCSRRHRFASRASVGLEEILKERLVLQRFAVDELKLMFQKYHAPDISMKISLISTRQVMIYEYIRDNMGISVVSQMLARMIDPKSEFATVPIREDPLLTLGLLMPKELRSPACRNFSEFVRTRASSVKQIDAKVIKLLREG